MKSFRGHDGRLRCPGFREKEPDLLFSKASDLFESKFLALSGPSAIVARIENHLAPSPLSPIRFSCAPYEQSDKHDEQLHAWTCLNQLESFSNYLARAQPN
jgi:hypothetical protein